MTSGSIIVHKQKIYLLRIFSIDPASISVEKGLFSSKKHRSTRRNNLLHPGYLTSLVTRTNHNTIQTIGIYEFSGQLTTPERFSYHAGCRYYNVLSVILVTQSCIIHQMKGHFMLYNSCKELFY